MYTAYNDVESTASAIGGIISAILSAHLHSLLAYRESIIEQQFFMFVFVFYISTYESDAPLFHHWKQPYCYICKKKTHKYKYPCNTPSMHSFLN